MHCTSGWIVEHVVGPLNLGTLVVKPRRHVLHLADLDDCETLEMGKVLRRAARVVTVLCKPSQVYVCQWSHPGGSPVHLHFVVQPIGSEQIERFGGTGPRLQASMFEAGVWPVDSEVAAYCDRARRLFEEGDQDECPRREQTSAKTQ